jgi:hypothetical protein
LPIGSRGRWSGIAFPWPLAKLDIVNRALAAIGDNLVIVADTADEWNTCSPNYDMPSPT